MKAAAKLWLWVGVFVFGSLVAVVVWGLISSDDSQFSRSAVSTRTTLRLSGSQLLFNWQSFSGREVVVEFCTVTVASGQGTSCLVFSGGQRLGEINIDAATFDPESSAWVAKTCQGRDPKATCSVRLSGTIRKADSGSPLLIRAKILL